MTELRAAGLSGFAELLDGLSFAGGRNAKLKLMADWLRATPDPDRGWGLAALTGGLDLPGVKPALIRALIEDRVDPVLFRLSYDYVGDLAETVSLLWEGCASMKGRNSGRAVRSGGPVLPSPQANSSA